MDALTNPRQYWSKPTKEKRKTLLSKFFDFGEDFKITDLEMSGKSNKQQVIDKSSITKVWSTTQCTHLLFLVKIMAELCLCFDLLNLNGLACENDCSVKWKIKQQCFVALQTAWLFNSKLFYIHIQSLFSLISFLCRSISCSHFSITLWQFLKFSNSREIISST